MIHQVESPAAIVLIAVVLCLICLFNTFKNLIEDDRRNRKLDRSHDRFDI